jgi:hypothetical protein
MFLMFRGELLERQDDYISTLKMQDGDFISKECTEIILLRYPGRHQNMLN